MKREEMAKRLEGVMKAASDFIEISDVPTHLRNSEVYKERRAELKTVASLALSQLLPDEEEENAYIRLAQAVQLLMELLDDVQPPGTAGVTRRGQYRERYRLVNALVGQALGKDS